MSAPQPAPRPALTVPDLPADADCLTAAFTYARAGWYIGPVALGTKHPGSILGKGWQSKTTRDPEIIADTWLTHPDAGIFLHVGRSGGIVIDVDTPTRLPDVLTTALTDHPAPFQRTRRNDAARRHYIYAQPPGRTLGNGLGRLPHGWGDLRGANGVIVVAPTIHPETDGHYTWGRTGPIPVLPATIAELLTDTTTPVDVATDQTIRAFITRHDTGTDTGKLRALTATFRRAVDAGDSRHQRALSILTGALKEAAAGYYPAAHAEETLRHAFLDAVARPGHGQQGKARTGTQALEEWRGILAWAVAQADHADPTATVQRAEEHAPTVNLDNYATAPAPAPVEPTQHTATPAPATAAASPLDRILDPDTAHDTTQDAPPPSWRPLDLTGILDGTYERPEPTIMARTDGPSLFYPGKVHTVYGESESGKSWVAQHATVDVLHADGRVLYIDFESDAPDVTGRLTALGAQHDQLLSNAFAYVRPEASPHTFAEAPEFQQLLEQTWDLAILDGVTEALGLAGKSSLDNDEITAWMRDIPRRIARHTGAAVILVDHVVKATEGRGRFPLGGQAKMAAIDGTGYLVEPVTALGVGLDGTLTIRVTKDRPGAVRAHAGDWRKSDRTQEAARVRVDSSTGDGTVHVTVEPPEYGQHIDHDPAKPFRPTKVMEKVSRILETMREPLSRQNVIRTYRETGKAKEATIVDALNLLVEGGFLLETTGPRNARMFRSAAVYRSHTDPASDDYAGDLKTLETPTSSHLIPPHPDLIPDEDATSSQRPHPIPSPLRGGDEVESRVENDHTRRPHPNPDDVHVNKLTGEITTDSGTHR